MRWERIGLNGCKSKERRRSDGSDRRGCVARRCALFALAGRVLAGGLGWTQQPPRSPIPAEQASAGDGFQNTSMADYRRHLEALTAVVGGCTKARDAKGCDPARVGMDDRVALGAAPHVERRMVRYDWLRALLVRAQTPIDTTAAKKPAASANGTLTEDDGAPAPPTTADLLRDAQARLAEDLAQTASAEPNYTAQRGAMRQVLAGRAFRGLEEPVPRQTLMEKFGNWLNALFDSAARFGARAAWLGRAVVWGFILAVCAGLAWGLIQLEQRWRVRLTPENRAPQAELPSARDWQLWLNDARQAAAAGAWRDAIHCVYWAAIARLESQRLWPADRARTPREYLALVTDNDLRRGRLAALTGSFERTWYGGRAAGEGDYRRAEELALNLIGRGGASLAEGGGAAR